MINSLKLNENSYGNKGLENYADNRLTGSAQQNKRKFDELVKDVIHPKINAILDALSSIAEGASGADQIACAPIDRIDPTVSTIQGALSVLASRFESSLPTVVMPTGAVMAFALKAPPHGWLACDGAIVDRSAYIDLYNALKVEVVEQGVPVYRVPWGDGDGMTTFQLPDFRGYFLRGWNNLFTGPDGGRGWAAAQADQNKAHTHTVTDAYVSPDTVYYNSETNSAAPRPKTQSSVTRTTSSSGGNEGRPINKPVLYCIKT